MQDRLKKILGIFSEENQKHYVEKMKDDLLSSDSLNYFLNDTHIKFEPFKSEK